MFRLTQAGDERGDATAPYAVTLDKDYTVREFVQTVLSVQDEWGHIGVDDGHTIFGDPCCDYDRGRLKSSLPEEILDKKVTSVKADGGWSRMDYLLSVSQEDADPAAVIYYYDCGRDPHTQLAAIAVVPATYWNAYARHADETNTSYRNIADALRESGAYALRAPLFAPDKGDIGALVEAMARKGFRMEQDEAFSAFCEQPAGYPARVLLRLPDKTLLIATVQKNCLAGRNIRDETLCLFHRILDETGHDGVHKVEHLTRTPADVLARYGVALEPAPADAFLDLSGSTILSYLPH